MQAELQDKCGQLQVGVGVCCAVLCAVSDGGVHISLVLGQVPVHANQAAGQVRPTAGGSGVCALLGLECCV